MARPAPLPVPKVGLDPIISLDDNKATNRSTPARPSLGLQSPVKVAVNLLEKVL